MRRLATVLASMRRDDRYWSTWTGLWHPWQQSDLIAQAGLDGSPDRIQVRARKYLIQVNRLMTVTVSALFARRLEQQHIDRVSERRALGLDTSPTPTPRVHEEGSLRAEYDRISSLGKKKKTDSTRAAEGDGPTEPAVRVDLASDQELDQEWESGRDEDLLLRGGAYEDGPSAEPEEDTTHTANRALGVVRREHPTNTLAVDTF